MADPAPLTASAADPRRAGPSPRRPGTVTSSRRLDFATVRAVIRNPLDALPPEVFDAPVIEGVGGQPQRWYLLDPELIQEVLVRRADIFPKTPENKRVLGRALGDGLLTAEGAHWRWQRRAAAPAFQPAKLAALAPPMLEAARETRDRWLQRPGRPLRVNHEMMRTTFDIILATMLSGPSSGPGGVDPARFEAAITDTLTPIGWALAVTLLRLPPWTPYPGKARARRAVDYLRRATARLAADRRAVDAGGREDLLTLLQSGADPETGRAMSDEEIVDNLLTFISAGHETTALALAWTLHLLPRAPDVEARLLAEIDAVTGGAEVLPEHLPRMEYTRQVFNEAMRLYPPAPMISRQAAEDVDLGGLTLKAGEVAIIPIYALHRHRLLWDEPERFDPDRFAPEAVAARHRFAFMPFGGGPRVCIGGAFALQEAVAVLAVVLQRLRVRPVADAVDPAAVMRVTLRPLPELVMTAEPR